MLGPDQLADVEGDAMVIYGMAKADPEEPPSIAELCLELTKREPGFATLRNEARLVDQQVIVRPGTFAPRARWLAAHELAEWYYAFIGYDGDDIEERCDACGAALVAPRPAFRLAMKVRGGAVYALASDFATTQSLALLRIGEVTGRPVRLLRWPRPITRGEPFLFPRLSEIVSARDRSIVHPLRIRDEPNRWGLMAC
jgi:hypothetical protein